MAIEKDRFYRPSEGTPDSPLEKQSSANPLQPGDPFKRGNFPRFALGMAAVVLVLGIVVVACFYFLARHANTPHAPAGQTRLQWTEPVPPSLGT